MRPVFQKSVLTLVLAIAFFTASSAGTEDTMRHEHHARAYWLDSSTLAWNPPADAPPSAECEFQLLVGAEPYPLVPSGNVGVKRTLAKRFPYLLNYQTLQGTITPSAARAMIKQPLSLVVRHPSRGTVFHSGVQTFGVIDAIATYKGEDLGVRFSETDIPTVKLWAPTAQSVALWLFADPLDPAPAEVVDMTFDNSGVWTATGRPEWKGAYYLYEVEVYVPYTGKVEKNLVTDPYSTSLSTNAKRSFMIDLRDPLTFPTGWKSVRVQGPPNAEDIAIYELHIRDFSANDTTVDPELRGKFLGFSDLKSYGMKHLRQLAAAGLTHVHLLPAFDFGSVNEDVSQQITPQIPNGLAPDSPEAARIIDSIKDKDAYNWGYDPVHYFSPEGSYATDPDGLARIVEFREMIIGLHKTGLNAVLDTVLNHTYRGGQDEKSILDRVVPGYYHRLDANGKIQGTACGDCADTATERFMMEKLMIDSVVSWAKNYKVAGFRFDLMGFHTLSNLKHLRAALNQLTLEKDGIDGSRIYLYGEGWKFGSLEAILPNETANQMNLYGAGVGSFNDRFRDRARGGGFMTETKADQGFITGLYYDNNGIGSKALPQKPRDLRGRLLQYTDAIRVGMAGNLRNFRFRNSEGKSVTGAQIDYHGSPVGYAARPGETINYVSAHDNYDLWDQIAAKAAFQKPDRYPETASIEDRVRMQKLGLALVALGQGVPFFHAGSEFLRSKSGDNNSYNSGDWFNRMDFSLRDNNWGVGLPPGENSGDAAFWAPRLRDPELRASAKDMESTTRYFQALLEIRRDSALLRLTTTEDVQARLRFLETDFGKEQPPGLIVMALQDSIRNRPKLDSSRKLLLVAINVTRHPISFRHSFLKDRKLRLHPNWTEEIEPRVLDSSFTPERGTLAIPAQTVLVYEEPRLKPKR